MNKSGFIATLLAIGFAALSGVLWLQLQNRGPAQPAAAAMTGAVATVNGQEISKETLYQRMVDRSGEQALDELITEVLIQQEAQKAKITVSETELKAELDKLKEQFGTEAEFEMALAQANLTLEQLEQRIEVQTLVKELLLPRIQDKLTDAAIAQYYEANKSDLATQKESVHARHILLTTEDEAKAVRNRLSQGEDFAALAKELSIEPAAKESGGDLGTFERGKMVPEFEDAAFILPVGELSQPVQSQFGWHIIEVLERTDPVIPSLESVKEKIKSDLADQEINMMAGGWLTEIKGKADIQNTLTAAQ